MSSNNTTSNPSPRVHYGWVVAIACCVISALGTGLLMNSLGTFIKPVSEAVGFDRGEFSLAVSMLSFVGIFVFPTWGKLMQKLSVRKLIILAACVISVCMYCISFCTELWQFYVLHIIIGLFNGGVATLPVSTLISRWFVSKKGTAMGIATCGSGLGSMLLVPLVSSVMQQQSWQAAYRFLGILFFVAAMLSAVFFIRDNPAAKGLKPYRTEDPDGVKKSTRLWAGLTKAQAMKTDCMKFFAVAITLTGLLYSGMISHVYAYLTDIGFAAGSASAIVSASMFILLISKFVLGILFDRFGAMAGAYLAYGSFALAFLCLLGASYAQPFLYAYCLFGGFGVSISAVGIAYLTDYLFGPKEYSLIFGVVSSLLLLGTTLGTTLSGFLFDTFGSYRPAWVIYFVIVLLVVFFMTKANGCYRRAIVPMQESEEP